MITAGHVLVVDDEKAQRDILTVILEGEGYTVETASNVSQALTAYRNHRADVVLTDLSMPERDGLALLEELIKLDPGARHPGHGLRDDRLRGPGNEEGRLRLPRQAGGPGRAADHDRACLRTTAPRQGEPAAATTAPRRVQSREHHRPPSIDGGGLSHH